MRKLLLCGLLCLAALGPGAWAWGQGVTVITPPRLWGTIEFLDRGTGLNQWRVRLPSGEVLIRVPEACERDVGALIPGHISPIYENLSFLNARGQECVILSMGR